MHGSVEQATRIFTQIEDDALYILGFEIISGFLHEIGRVIGKGTDLNIANIIIENLGLHTGQRDIVTDNLEGERRFVVANDLQGHGGTLGAPNFTDGSINRHASGTCAINTGNQILCFDAGFISWQTTNWRYNFQITIAILTELSTNATK